MYLLLTDPLENIRYSLHSCIFFLHHTYVVAFTNFQLPTWGKLRVHSCEAQNVCDILENIKFKLENSEILPSSFRHHLSIS